MTIERPNFLGSEVGLVLKTASLDATTNASIVTSETDSDGNARSIVKKGSIFADAVAGIYGLVYQDIDVTGSTATTKVPAPIMVGGYFINDASVLPVVITSNSAMTLDKAASQGLFPVPGGLATVTRNVVAEEI
jgi:hypothetical protein